MEKIRVLVVDDSPLFREFIIKGLESDDRIEVCGVAGDPYEARDQIIKLRPDVMTCDIEMPKMDGLEFVTKLIPQYPIPVVMISSLSDKVFDAMKAGAVDFVGKPAVNSRTVMQQFISEQLIPKIIAASKAVVDPRTRRFVPLSSKSAEKSLNNSCDLYKNLIIAIGASTGGTEAISQVINAFPSNMPGIVITQHIPPMFSAMFADRLSRQSNLECKEAATGDVVLPGHVYVAPGDRQMRIIKVGNNYQIECRGDERVNGHCPSVDVLFDSVAKVAGKNAIGIILTGMGADGAKGLLNMRNAGAITIGQDKESSIVYGMPMEAYKLGAVKFQLPLSDIPKRVDSLLARFR